MPTQFSAVSSVMQYLEKPYDWIQCLCGLGLDYVVLDLMPLMDTHDRLTIQHVDPAIYPASYPCWFLNKQKVIQAFHPAYRVLAEFEAYIGKDLPLGFSTFNYRGILFQRKEKGS